MERLELQRSTRFLAKKYFDYYLNKQTDIMYEKISLVLITCIRTAVKVKIYLIQFNELAEIADEYTIEFCCEQCEGQFAPEDFKAC